MLFANIAFFPAAQKVIAQLIVAGGVHTQRSRLRQVEVSGGLHDNRAHLVRTVAGVGETAFR